MYSIVYTASYIIRTFMLPNPFECFGVYAFWINLIAGGPIHMLTYNLVGTVYNRGECPPLGCVLYLTVYFIINRVLLILGKFSFAWWSILALVAILVALKYAADKIFSCI